jgi:hypothetical protein
MALMAGAAGGSRHMRPAMRATLMLETEVSAPIESAGIHDLPFERTVVNRCRAGPENMALTRKRRRQRREKPRRCQEAPPNCDRRSGNHLLTDAGQ